MAKQQIKDLKQMVQVLMLDRQNGNDRLALPPENIDIEWEPYSKRQVKGVVAKITRGTWTAEDLEE